ncbi:MAG TPA: BrnA antitoxin family protein [Oculatellaceae cyanobacterium]
MSAADKAKKSRASSQRASSHRESGDAWHNYDYENLPELNAKQLASFRPVTANEHQRFRDGTVRPVGRPRKPAEEKGQLVSMRFTPKMLAALKARAKASGVSGWQTYAKQVLQRHLAKT